MAVSLFFLFLQLAFALLMFFLLLSFVTGGPFVPSSKKTSEAMVTLARLRPGQTAYDIGSGDGRLLMIASRQGANAIGIEINPYLVLYSRIRASLSPYRGKITVLWGNLWKTDLSGADALFVYLLPWRMGELAALLKRELKPGTLVITNSFIFPGWPILRKDRKRHVYVYKI